MTPERAGQLCDQLDKELRGSEHNLTMLAGTIVVVMRDQAWRRRRLRTGEVVECASFLELLTAAPLKGFGEDPKKVEALLKDDAEALRMFREATVSQQHKHKPNDSNNITVKPVTGTSRAYTLARLHKTAPALYQRVVTGELSANAAAIQAGFRRPRTLLDQMRAAWSRITPDQRRVFLSWVRKHEADRSDH